MKTARMATPSLTFGSAGIMGSSATNSTQALESAVDAYAARVVQQHSPSDAYVDDSVGPYVAQLLRCASLESNQSIQELAEFESLVELLQDQCGMTSEKAHEALEIIAEAVSTGVIPDALSSFQSLGAALEEAAEQVRSGSVTTEVPPSADTAPSAANPPVGPEGPSPLKPDSLLPLDLLGDFDEPPTPKTHVPSQENRNDFPPLGATANEEAFPPLGAVASTVPSSGKKSKKKSKRSSRSNRTPDENLAAALFRPSRPRQNSITDPADDSSGSPALSSTVAQEPSLPEEYDEFFQAQLGSCVEVLLSMNQELGEDAAAKAAAMANADFNIAHYIVDTAMTAPPICRHVLQDGCYRSDCTFSHDVEGHTCLFWLRGRCGKVSCKFLHGFSSKILDGMPVNPSHTVAPGFLGGHAQQTPPPGFASSSNGGLSGMQGAPSWGSQAQTVVAVPKNVVAATAPSGGGFSFANIAAKGGSEFRSGNAMPPLRTQYSSGPSTVRIPQDLWNPHENRDASAFHIADPLERYAVVMTTVRRHDVIDLHFQSTKTFPVVLSKVLPQQLAMKEEIWIVTGTGHHVGSRTHQRGGGALERAVLDWLEAEGYNFSRGKDRNGLGGAILVKR